MTKNIKKLKGGTFNLYVGRKGPVVKSEVERLLKKHDNDFLVIQEGADYVSEMSHVKGYNYFTTKGSRSGVQMGFLVKKEHKVDKVNNLALGDGWTTVTGAHHAPTDVPSIRINGWARICALHMPTPTHWINGRLTGPNERVDDYIAIAKWLTNWMKRTNPFVARLAVGDWNEAPTTQGEYTPKNIAARSGSRLAAPKSRVGHGIIDYCMVKGAKVVNIYKDLEIKEASDHEPVIFTLIKR